MAHPRTYSDNDPHLDDLRGVCLELPEATEVEAWGRPTFRAGKKMFAAYGAGADGASLGLHVGFDRQEQLLAVDVRDNETA